MSNRSLIEINHDFSHAIQADGGKTFLTLLGRYLGSANDDTAEALRLHFGCTVFGMRHHSDPWEGKVIPPRIRPR